MRRKDVCRQFKPAKLWPVLAPQLEGQVVALLVQNMERLDEQVKEEADGIHNTLGKRHSTPNVNVNQSN